MTYPTHQATVIAASHKPNAPAANSSRNVTARKSVSRDIERTSDRNDTLSSVAVSTKITQANKLDDLRAARGVIYALGLSVPFWAPAVLWVLM